MTSPMSAGTNSFAVCIRNDEYPVALELRKIYAVIPDPGAEQYGMIRVIDESGEDYLYPHEYFRSLDLPTSVEADLLRAS